MADEPRASDDGTAFLLAVWTCRCALEVLGKGSTPASAISRLASRRSAGFREVGDTGLEPVTSRV